MKLLKSALLFIAFFSLTYLFIAFYTTEINFVKWPESSRFIQVYFGGLVGTVLSVAKYFLQEEK